MNFNRADDSNQSKVSLKILIMKHSSVNTGTSLQHFLTAIKTRVVLNVGWPDFSHRSSTCTPVYFE